jgi:hypothetical protein
MRALPRPLPSAPPAHLTTLQWAVLAVVRGQPYGGAGGFYDPEAELYRFAGPERLAAERLVTRGLLRRTVTRGLYAMTAAGDRAFVHAIGAQ